eukprot:527924-Amphidinium_carterae.1
MPGKYRNLLGILDLSDASCQIELEAFCHTKVQSLIAALASVRLSLLNVWREDQLRFQQQCKVGATTSCVRALQER